MTPKRIHPSLSFNQQSQNTFQKPFDQDLSQYECLRKQIKKDLDSFQGSHQEEEHMLGEMASSSDLNLEADNIYGQEFQNLGACSFKTISKIGQQKFYPFSKNEVAQFDDKFSSANKKNRQSLAHLSEQKSIQRENSAKNMARNSGKKFVSFGSMYQISRMQKRNSVESGRFSGLVERIKKRESSFSGIDSGSLNSINTQMMNDIYDFTINDENQLDQNYLTKMVETALIKNVRFSANLYIRLLERKNEEKFYYALKMYKLLDVDGFSITGFYAETQKVKVNLGRPITNKEFEKKFVLQPQPHSNIREKSKQETTKEHGVQFKGSFYSYSDEVYEDAVFFLSDIKDNFKNHSINKDQIENVNYENWMIPRDNFECHINFNSFAGQKNESKP